MKQTHTYAVAAAYLRLSTKYDMPHLRIVALHSLSFYFPQTLDGFDKVWNSPPDKKPPPNIALATDAIHLARETRAHVLLPSAFYATLCRTHNLLDLILDGTKRSDGSSIVLSASDQKVALKGWQKLMSLRLKTTFTWIHQKPTIQSVFPTSPPTRQSCTSLSICTGVMKTKYNTLAGPTNTNWMTCNALQQWDASCERDLCSSCVVTFKNRHNAGRPILWEKLPSVFGLPEWAVLSK